MLEYPNWINNVTIIDNIFYWKLQNDVQTVCHFTQHISDCISTLSWSFHSQTTTTWFHRQIVDNSPSRQRIYLIRWCIHLCFWKLSIVTLIKIKLSVVNELVLHSLNSKVSKETSEIIQQSARIIWIEVLDN